MVEAWSLARLPYGRKAGWTAGFRHCLQQSLRCLRFEAGQILHAQYESDDESLCDVENVLIYNVGEGAFKDLARSGLRFERAFAEPSQPARHSYRYNCAERDGGFAFWRTSHVIARWTAIDCGSGGLSVAGIWHAMRNGVIETQSDAPASGRFGLRVVLHGGGVQRRNAAGLVKKVFDGIICAFHSHDGDRLDEVSERVGRGLGQCATAIAAQLTHPRLALLGPRKLIWPYRKHVQWSPADDRCVAGELLLDPGPGTWKLSGEIATLSASAAPLYSENPPDRLSAPT